MGPYGPIWALEERENFRKNMFFMYMYCMFSQKSLFWTTIQRVLMEKRVLQVSDRNTVESDYKITSKSKFSTQNVQIP